MKVVAHRGACTEALENSWDAFQKAVLVGADRIELDVHLTRDGHPAIIHDEDFRRTADSPQRVADMSRSEIEQTIRLSNGEPVPFLDQVLSELLPKIEFNVEIKSQGIKTIEAVGELVSQQKFPGKVIISSFDLDTCSSIRRAYSNLQVALLWDRSLIWPWSFHWGPKRFMQQHGIRIFHPDAKLVTPSLVRQIKTEGWDIIPYVGLKSEHTTVELWTYLMTCRVDGLCTNYPRELKVWLQEVVDDSKRFQDIPALANRKI